MRVPDAQNGVFGRNYEGVGALQILHEIGGAFPPRLARRPSKQMSDHFRVRTGGRCNSPLRKPISKLCRVDDVPIVSERQLFAEQRKLLSR